MKRLIFSLIVLSAIIFTLVRCKLEGSNYSKTLVTLNLTSWNLPDQAVVSVPFNIRLYSCTENTCYGDIYFKITTDSGKKYVYAQSFFENTGEECPLYTVCNDSTVSVTITQAGKYYYYFAYNDIWNKDSIEVVNP